MEKQIQKDSKVSGMLKALFISYVITGALLLLLALLLFRLNLDEQKVTFGIAAIYVISTFFGGILIGRTLKQKRFLWGFAVGVCYFLLLLLISFGVYRTLEMEGLGILTTFLLCAGGGTLGGMIS